MRVGHEALEAKPAVRRCSKQPEVAKEAPENVGDKVGGGKAGGGQAEGGKAGSGKASSGKAPEAKPAVRKCSKQPEVAK